MQKNEITETKPTGIFLMISAAVSTATGQLFWKLSDSVLLGWEIWVGFLLYGIGAILMTSAFRFGQLSVLHPILSLGYVIAIAYGSVFLNEPITLNVSIGTLLIIAGVIFIGGEKN